MSVAVVAEHVLVGVQYPQAGKRRLQAGRQRVISAGGAGEQRVAAVARQLAGVEDRGFGRYWSYCGRCASRRRRPSSDSASLRTSAISGWPSTGRKKRLTSITPSALARAMCCSASAAGRETPGRHRRKRDLQLARGFGRKRLREIEARIPRPAPRARGLASKRENAVDFRIRSRTSLPPALAQFAFENGLASGRRAFGFSLSARCGGNVAASPRLPIAATASIR